MKIHASLKTVLVPAVFLLAQGLMPMSARAQNAPEAVTLPEVSGADLRFTHLSTDAGLSQSHIYAILQDRQGFMWFATRDGLNRYDGNTFVVFKHNPDDLATLSANYTVDLLEDDQGCLWIACNNGGVNKFDPATERFTRYRHDPENPNSISDNSVESMLQDRHGQLWFGTAFNGLNKLDPATKIFTRFRHDSTGQLVGRIAKIIEDRQGEIWFVGSRGLHHLDPQTGQITRPAAALECLAAEDIHEDQAGSLWMVAYSPAALIRYDRQAERLTKYPLDANGLTSCNLLDDGENGFWVPSKQGLFHFDRETESFTRHFQHDETNPDSLSDNNVVSVFQDRSGLLWLGTENGGINILNFQQEHFGYCRHNPANPNSLSPGRVDEIYEDPAGVLWVGFFPRALDRFDRRTGQITTFVPDPENDNTLSQGYDINSIHRDARGYVWLGGWDSGLDRFDECSGQFKHYRHNPDDPNSLISDNVLDIYEDRSGSLWLGQSDGLSRFDPATEQFTNYRHDPNDPRSLGHSAVRNIYQDRSGALWLGTWQGVLSRFDDRTKTFRNYRPDSHDPRRLNGGSIYAIHEDRTGNLWLGASDGLYRFNRENETFIRYTESKGLPSSSIEGLLEDAAGRLWLSTRKGVSRFDPQTETFRNYGVSDGLQGNDFNESCYAQGRSGEMFFGGSKGLNAFFPEQIRDNPYVPPVVLTEFQLFNKPVAIGKDSPLQKAINVTDRITLRYDQEVFRLRFAALSYASPQKNRYAYKLEGFDQAWRYTDASDRSATYTKLPPGNYTFRVKASNNDGVWNEAGVSTRITIIPPWWGTWWFRGTAVTALLGLAYLGYALRVRSLNIRHQNLERQVAERTAQLQAANKELESFSYSVSHDLRAPLRHIDGYVELLSSRCREGLNDQGLRYLDTITHSTRRMGALIDDLLQFSRTGRAEMKREPVNMNQVLQEVLDLLKESCADRSIEWMVGNLPSIEGDGALLHQVWANLLGNAVKYTRPREAARIEVGAREENGETVFFVADNGAGFDMRYADKLFGVFQRLHAPEEFEGTGIGLATVHRIVTRHGGRVWAESKLNEGATFYFTLPRAAGEGGAA